MVFTVFAFYIADAAVVEHFQFLDHDFLAIGTLVFLFTEGT